MKLFFISYKIKAFLPFLMFCFTAAFTFVGASELSSKQSAKAGNLFIIVANGIRYDDAFGHKIHLYTEKIWSELRPLGTICTRFYNTGLTYPIPAQASLLTGMWHVWKNPLSDTIHPAFPTLFEYWKKMKSDNSCYFAANKKRFGILRHSYHQEYGKNLAPLFDINTDDSSATTDSIVRKTETNPIGNAIYDKAVAHIFTHHPSFVFLNLDSGSAENSYPHDHEHLHKDQGCEGEANLLNSYYESIILTDTIVYDLWNRIQRDEVYKDKTVFIFLSAHGRHIDDYRIFGDNSRGCQQLNFLIIGPGVKKNFISKKKRTLIDICSTVGALCAIPVPFAKGSVMKEILE